MQALVTSSNRRTGSTARVHDVLAVVVLSLVQQGLQTRLREAPGSRVERLLLAPDDSLGVGVLVEVLLQLLPGEGVQLLKTSEGDVVDLVVGAVLGQSGPDLTRAEDDTVNLLLGLNSTSLMLRIGNDPSEVRISSELLNVGAGKRVTQESLGEEDDKSCFMLAGILC